MEKYMEYLRAQNAALKEEAEKLKKDDRIDESNLAKVRANIYDVCAAVCKVHMNRPGGGPDAYRAQLEKFKTQWSAERERVAAHGDTEKAIIEDIKLEALADIAAKFEEAAE